MSNLGRIAVWMVVVGSLLASSGRADEARLIGEVQSYDQSEGPLKDVFITVLRGDEILSDDQSTDKKGRYAIDALPMRADLTVRFSKVGYQLDPEIRRHRLSSEEEALNILLMPRGLLEGENQAALVASVRNRIESGETSFERELAWLSRFGLDSDDRRAVAVALGVSGSKKLRLRSPFGEPSSLQLAPEPRIAILSVTAPGVEGENLGKQIAGTAYAALVAELNARGGYEVVERSFLDMVVERNSRDLVVDDMDVVEMGRLDDQVAIHLADVLSVQFFLVASVVEFRADPSDAVRKRMIGTMGKTGLSGSFEAYEVALNVRLLDAQTGQVVWGALDRASTFGSGDGFTLEQGKLVHNDVDPAVDAFERIVRPLVEKLIERLPKP